jgi:hypothetical protein
MVGCTEVIREQRSEKVAWSMLNQELSIVRASICSRVKNLEWVKNPALFHAFSSLSFFLFEAS